MAKNDLQGALDLLILKTLSQLNSMHGYGIVMHIRRVSDELLIVKKARSIRAPPHGTERLGARQLGRHRLRRNKMARTLRVQAGSNWPAGKRIGSRSPGAWTRYCVSHEVNR